MEYGNRNSALESKSNYGNISWGFASTNTNKFAKKIVAYFKRQKASLNAQLKIV